MGNGPGDPEDSFGSLPLENRPLYRLDGAAYTLTMTLLRRMNAKEVSPMKTDLYNYDIFPKVFPENNEIALTIKPLGRHAAFAPGEAYQVDIMPMLERRMMLVEKDGCIAKRSVTPDADGCLRFCHTFQGEQEFFITVRRAAERVCTLSVYALGADLACLYPFLGDLHVHSTYSDGQQAPEIVAADYRRRGYDFTTLTDHQNYAGSLAAIRAYQNVPIDLTIVPGEEVHLPDNDIHLVHFGGNYSVNFLLKSRHTAARESGIDTEREPPDRWCAFGGADMPIQIDDEEYRRQVNALANTLDIPDTVDRFAYASSVWICREIRKAGGLSIFAHPYWIKRAYHVPLAMTELMLRTHPFDAFEVLGGERYLEQNEFQTYHYVECRARGWNFPVVGSSDSHGVYNNVNSADAATIVFASACHKDALIEAVRQGHCVAVDLISAEKRLVGELRFVRYARFLLENYFPLHDELCYEEGRLMKAYICGQESNAADMLARHHGRTQALRERYFLTRQGS